MKIITYIGKHFVPKSIYNLIKYILFGRRFTYTQVKPFHIFWLASEKTVLHPTAWVDPNMTIVGSITMGRYSYARSPYISFVASIEHMIHIGSFCSIAQWVQIYSSNDHDYTKLTTFPPAATWLILWDAKDLWKEVVIWHDVWIGANAIILPGVTIGTWAVIWAGSVVTKDIPPYAIAAGAPCHIIKYRFSEPEIESMLKSQWWEWDIEKIRQNYNLEFLRNA